MSMRVAEYRRPVFLDAINEAYTQHEKSVILLSGNTRDYYWCATKEKFLSLEQTLVCALAEMFTVVSFDIARGIDFYDARDLLALSTVCTQADSLTVRAHDKIGDLQALVRETRHDPLASLVVLQEVLAAVLAVRRDRDRDSNVAHKHAKAVWAELGKMIKPVCTIVRFAGSLFPSGEFEQLSDPDRQRIVFFLNLVESVWYQNSNHLAILLTDTASDVNQKLLLAPSLTDIEIELPNAVERSKFVAGFMSQWSSGVSFEDSQDQFVADSAGLTLNSVATVLEGGRRNARSVGRQETLCELSKCVRIESKATMNVSQPKDVSPDIVGAWKTGEIFLNIFRRCTKPDTAIPAFLVCGPSGSGKSFQLQAIGAASGRIVIEMKSGRGFASVKEVEEFLARIRLRLRASGKAMIIVDDAHLQLAIESPFGPTEIESLLIDYVVEMIGDRAMLGKVIWVFITSRPDRLNAKILSLLSVRVPIFDLEPDERGTYLRQLFEERNVYVSDSELEAVINKTRTYSIRDYDLLYREVEASGNRSVWETLKDWRACSTPGQERRLQTLLAVQHCSYPTLVPESLKSLLGTENLEHEIRQLQQFLVD